MANNLDINKAIGDVAKLNTELKETAVLIGNIVKNQQTLSSELGKTKGLGDLNKKQNEVKKTQNEIEKQGNKLLGQRNDLIAAQDKKIRVLTKEVIKEQIAKKKLNDEIKEEITGEKKAAEIKKLKTEATKRATAAIKAQKKETINLITELRKEIKTEEQAAEQSKKLIAVRKKLDSTTAKGRKQIDLINKTIDRNNKLLDKNGSKLAQQKNRIGQYENATKGLRGGLQKVGKSLLAFGAGFVGVNVGIKAAKELLKTVFLGTQENMDFFSEKLEGIKGQFAVLTDSISNFGQTVVEAFASGEDGAATFLSRIAKSNPLFIALKFSLEELKLLFPATAEAMRKNGEEAELLQKMMNDLNEKEVEYIGTKAQLTKEMRLARLEAKKAGDDDEKALSFVDKAISTEKELMANEMTFAKERSKIATERLKLSISTRQDRKEAAILAARVIELEVTSIKRLTTLEAERLSLIRRINSAKKKEGDVDTEITNDRISNIEKLESKELKSIESRLDPIARLTITWGDLYDRLEEWEINYTKFIEEQELIRKDLRKQIGLQIVSDAASLGNSLFDLGQSQRDRELEGIRSNYSARIAAAEGNNDKQELLARQLAREEAEIQLEQAKSERNQQLFNLAITTAQKSFEIKAQAALLASNPVTAPLAGLALSQLALLLGSAVASAAIITSQPLPKVPEFFKGTESAPVGLISVAERGSELINMPDGSSFLAQKQMYLNDVEGAEILTHQDTTKALNSAIYSDAATGGDSGLKDTLNMIGHKLDNLKQVNVNLDANGHEIYMRKGNSSVNYINSRVKL